LLPVIHFSQFRQNRENNLNSSGHSIECLGERKEPMAKNWIGTVVLVGMSMAAGLYLSQIWEPVLGQHGSFSAEVPVVVNQPAELPKLCVDFVTVTVPTQGGRPAEIRVITVVDTEAKKIAVYHLEMATGKLYWRSTRDIQPELMVNQFNAMPPLPSEIWQDVQRFKGEK